MIGKPVDPLVSGLIARVARSNLARNVVASVLATGLRLVNATSRLTFVPRPSEAIFDDFAPFIATTWHGQAFMLPFVRPPSRPVDVLVSRDSDSEKIARMLLKLGCGVIRGSGATGRSSMVEEGSVFALRKLKKALDRGRTVAMTADFLGGARRKVSPGIVVLAKLSGRPIVPVALVSSLRFEKATWDRETISLPFGRAVCVFGDPISVPVSADEPLLEEKRREVETMLNAATARAYDIADRRRV
jgi:lysophospholipid acyltransferase (LPLAT)-like uncharacterized protein